MAMNKEPSTAAYWRRDRNLKREGVSQRRRIVIHLRTPRPAQKDMMKDVRQAVWSFGPEPSFAGVRTEEYVPIALPWRGIQSRFLMLGVAGAMGAPAWDRGIMA